MKKKIASNPSPAQSLRLRSRWSACGPMTVFCTAAYDADQGLLAHPSPMTAATRSRTPPTVSWRRASRMKVCSPLGRRSRRTHRVVT